MPISASPTPNPNALKFTVGVPVGGPITFTAETDDPLGSLLMAVSGVTSVFMTADFVTVTKVPEIDWSGIAPEVARILEEHSFEG